MSVSQTPLVELRGIHKRFGLIDVLSDVNLTVNRREIITLVGDNGAGKSTLLRILSGLTTPDSGSIHINGQEVTIPNVRMATSLGIGSVYQTLDFCENLDIAANIFLGNELSSVHGLRDDHAMHKHAREILKQLTSPLSAYRSIEGLSMGERQTVAIARALLTKPDIIVMDEPTSSLSVIQTAQLLSYIKALRDSGTSILLVCHNLPDVFAVSDRIAVIRHGKIVSVHHTADVSYEEVIGEIAGAKQLDDDFTISHTITKDSRKLISRYDD